ncbi:hypothetical protein [Amycolatopsis sp.]|uniref:hypothetical protein n=1 Tax=Amycolatopsis sp. TaxID=37632 RepID=UPI00262BB1FD|nr:hypothetical protein [Amycolatopsis sp.]
MGRLFDGVRGQNVNRHSRGVDGEKRHRSHYRKLALKSFVAGAARAAGGIVIKGGVMWLLISLGAAGWIAKYM